MTDPLIKRGPIRNVIGVEVDSMELTLLASADVQVQNVPLTQFARSGGFDGARVRVDRHFAASWQSQSCGSLNLFSGRVADLEITGAAVRMDVKADLELLNIMMPHNLYMGTCGRTLYGPGCNLSAAAFTVVGAAALGSNERVINCNLAQAAGYFDLGTVAFTTGPNAGVERTVRTHTSGVIVPSYPFPYAPEAGDLFDAKPGCDKLFATCNSAKFSNAANFRAFEFIPSPELTY